jgi:biopolymer transport protein TolR
MPAVSQRGRSRRTINEINMVPFIDVMLVLLIIFMVTAPLITPSVIDLPSVGKAAQLPSSVVQVLINKDESLEVKVLQGAKSSNTPDAVDNIKKFAINDIANAVKQHVGRDPSTAVVISADKAVKYEIVVQVMDKLKRAGVERVGLAVNIAK